jgi:hypothetical protein
MNRMTLAAWLIFAVAGTSQLTADEKKGGLSGRWVMDAERSSYGRMPLPKSYVEAIDQKVRIPTKVNADSEGNANGIPGRRRTVFGA